MKARILLILLVLSCLFCDPPERSFTIDPSSFSQNEQGIIKAAARSWDPILKDPITTSGGTWKVIRGIPPESFVAFTDNDTGIITVSPQVLDKDLYPVMLHEFGHSVGFSHHSEPGVMNPYYGSIFFSEADLSECEDLRRCK